MSIAAGQVKRMLPVIFYRDPSLEKDSVRLEIEIQSNEYFSVGMDTLSHFMVERTAKRRNQDYGIVFFHIYLVIGGQKKCGLLCGMSDSLISENRISDYAYKPIYGAGLPRL